MQALIVNLLLKILVSFCAITLGSTAVIAASPYQLKISPSSENKLGVTDTRKKPASVSLVPKANPLFGPSGQSSQEEMVPIFGRGSAIPSNAIPSNAIPSNAIPSNAIPSNAIPSNAIPSNAIPSNLSGSFESHEIGSELLNMPVEIVKPGINPAISNSKKLINAENSVNRSTAPSAPSFGELVCLQSQGCQVNPVFTVFEKPVEPNGLDTQAINDPVALIIRNRESAGGDLITDVFIKQNDHTDWGENQIKEPIQPGLSGRFIVDNISIYDVYVNMCSDVSKTDCEDFYEMDLQLTSFQTMIDFVRTSPETAPDQGSSAGLVIHNAEMDGGDLITTLYIYPSGSSDYGLDLIAEPIQPSSFFISTINKGGTYDVRATMCSPDGQDCELIVETNVVVSATSTTTVDLSREDDLAPDAQSESAELFVKNLENSNGYLISGFKARVSGSSSFSSYPLDQAIQPGSTVKIAAFQPGYYDLQAEFCSALGINDCTSVLKEKVYLQGTSIIEFAMDQASGVSIQMNETSNCRTGPGTVYPILEVIPQFTVVTAVKRYPSANYYVVLGPSGRGECWIWDNGLSIRGDINTLPVASAPPPPITATFTPTVTTQPIKTPTATAMVNYITINIQNNSPIGGRLLNGVYFRKTGGSWSSDQLPSGYILPGSSQSFTILEGIYDIRVDFVNEGAVDQRYIYGQTLSNNQSIGFSYP